MHSWDDFRYFLAVVECGSFSAAAKQLSVNHSTVSRRIQALEQSHGVKLFNRINNHYQMSDAGASIYELAQQLQQTSLQASRVLAGKDSQLSGEINLTMPHEVFDHILAKPLQQFIERYPEIQLNLMVSKGLRNMANREADLAVRISPSPPEYLIGSRVSYLQHGFFKHKDFDENAKNYTPIITWEKQHPYPEWAPQHFKNPKTVLRVDDLYSMYQAVKANIGIARMPCYLPNLLNSPEVARMPITIARSDWGIWVLNHVDLRNTARINVCRAFIKQALLEHKAMFIN